ncbi:MAG: DNA polymerase III subunit delta [Nitrospirota bacterium]
MSFQTFLQVIEKGLPSPVYLLSAIDPFLQREAIEEIRKLIPDEERDFNLNIFDLSLLKEENLPFDRILDAANTVSFFGRRRFVIVTGNLEKLSKKEIEMLERYISNPAPNSVFLIIHCGLLKREIRQRFATLKPISLDMRETEIPGWLEQKTKIKGLELSDEVVDYLIGLTGSDLGLLSSEIEKIALFGKSNITISDLSDIIEGSRSYSVFDLVDALKMRDVERVFGIYKILKETTEAHSLIGALNWQYGRDSLSQSRPGKEYLFKVFELLNDTDIDIKSSGRSFPVEYLLIKLLRL